MKNAKFWLVKEGEVFPAKATTQWDGETSILVFATSPTAALEVARAYDKGEIQPDNVWYEGRAVAAAFIQREDGSFL
jgi:precorrin isomerase